MQLDLKSLMKLYAQAAVIAIVCASPAAICFALYGTHAPAAVLLLTALTALIVWISSLLIVRHSLYYELRETISSFIESRLKG